MGQAEFTAEVRTLNGKKAINELRKNGKLPAVMYGNIKNTPLSLNELETKKILAKVTSRHKLIALSVNDGKKTTTHQALIQEIQKHVYKENLFHIDFKVVDETKTINVNAPIKAIGTPEGVKFGGRLKMVGHNMPITALPSAIPDYIEINVNTLMIGDTIRASQVKLPEGVKANIKTDFPLISIVGRQAEVEVDTAVEEGQEEATEETKE